MRPPWPHLAHRWHTAHSYGVYQRGSRCGHGGLVWPRQERPGVAKLLIQLHLVAFRCISFPNPHPALSLSAQGDIHTGMRGSRLHGNDRCKQCSNQRGYGVRGSCRWFGEVPPIHPYRGRMRGSRLHGNDGYEQCSNRRGYGVRGSCRWFEGTLGRRGVRAVREQPLHPYKGASTQGCEVPVFTGTTGTNNVAIGGAMA